MMQISSLIHPQRTSTSEGIANKKKALDQLAELLILPKEDETAGIPDSPTVFEALSAREKLGSTGLGHGVAIPHGRISGLDHPRLALLRLRDPVDFDAIDLEPVDLLIGLIVPEEATNEHLDLLAEIAHWLSQPNTIATLRYAPDDESLFAAIIAA